MVKKILIGLGVLGLSTGAAMAQTALTAGQARATLLNYGCATTSTMSQDSKGGWHATCWKGGAPLAVVVGPQGKPSLDTASSSGEMTESRARVAMMNAGCSTVSTMGTDSKGNWHSVCYKGGAPVPMMVTAQGTTTPDTAPTNEISEGRARVILTNFGCSNISTLDRTPSGSWQGSCFKGGTIPMTAVVDPSGKVATR